MTDGILTVDAPNERGSSGGGVTAPIILRIPGNTSSKKRQRFDPRTHRAYTPASNIIDENDVRAVWREAGEPRIADDVAISLSMRIYVTRPAGHFRKDGALSTEGLRHPVPRTRKPDVDNALKLVMDALNSRAWRDDVRVAKVDIERDWAEWAETVVEIAPWYGRTLPTTVGELRAAEAMRLGDVA